MSTLFSTVYTILVLMRLHLELIANIQTEIICKNTEMLFTAYSVSYTDLGNLTIHFYI